LKLSHEGAHIRIIPFTDARANLKRVIDQVVDDMDVTLITRRDAPNAVVMSQEYYDSLMETVHLLRSHANVAQLERSIAQARTGKVKRSELVDGTE
jgi:antitoxin YefM